ncbi:MAG: site-specific integrase [Acidobacteriales bacterium]|nr:site-specific integrase [Terriglobales bacterium]
MLSEECTTLKGKKPRAAGVAGQDYLRPAAVRAGVIPKDYQGRFGWHNLRHSLATFFAANEVNLPVIQSILRHAKPSTTAIYTHRVNAAHMAAQEKFLNAINVTASTVGLNLGLDKGEIGGWRTAKLLK